MKVVEMMLRAMLALESIAASLKRAEERQPQWYAPTPGTPQPSPADPGVPLVPFPPPTIVSYGCQPYTSTLTVSSTETPK